MVYFGWLLFRAASFAQAQVFLSAMVGLHTPSPNAPSFYAYCNTDLMLAIALGIAEPLPWLPVAAKWIQSRTIDAAEPSRVALAVSTQLGTTVFHLGVLALCSLLLGMRTYNAFIYYRS